MAVATRSGKQVIYRLTDERIVTLMSLIRDVAETNLAEMERLVSRLFDSDDPGGTLEAVSRDDLLAGLREGSVALLHALPRDRDIVAYCRGPYCMLSHEAVERLRKLGFRVRRFDEGFPESKCDNRAIHRPIIVPPMAMIAKTQPKLTV